MLALTPAPGGWCSAEVGPRRPRVKDTSNDLDYDVMSDQEWEEEPEGGESLSVRVPKALTPSYPKIV